MSRNKIVSIHEYTFYNNVKLVWLDLGRNSINYKHPSTFANVRSLTELHISDNKINSIAPETFTVNVELQWLSLNDNTITDIHPSTFQTNSKLAGLHMSGNKFATIKPGTYDNNGLIWKETAYLMSIRQHFEITGGFVIWIYQETK